MSGPWATGENTPFARLRASSRIGRETSRPLRGGQRLADEGRGPGHSVWRPSFVVPGSRVSSCSDGSGRAAACVPPRKPSHRAKCGPEACGSVNRRSPLPLSHGEHPSRKPWKTPPSPPMSVMHDCKQPLLQPGHAAVRAQPLVLMWVTGGLVHWCLRPCLAPSCWSHCSAAWSAIPDPSPSRLHPGGPSRRTTTLSRLASPSSPFAPSSARARRRRSSSARPSSPAVATVKSRSGRFGRGRRTLGRSRRERRHS
jgi:hypothetical protein